MGVGEAASWQNRLIEWVRYARRGSRIYDAAVIIAISALVTLLPQSWLEASGLWKFRGDIALLGIMGVIVMACTALDQLRNHRRLYREIERIPIEQLKALLDVVSCRSEFHEPVFDVAEMQVPIRKEMLARGLLVVHKLDNLTVKYKVHPGIAGYLTETFEIWKKRCDSPAP